MTETTVTFAPAFWNGTHPLSARQQELFNLLVPASGEASTAHGELLRAATRIYYDVCNNGLGNGPFPEEVATIRRHLDAIERHMVDTNGLRPLLRAVAPPGAEWGSTHIRELSRWPHGPMLDALMAAVVTVVDERVRALEASGQPADTGPTLVPATHALAEAEAQLAQQHLQGRHARTLAGEVFRAARALAHAVGVRGLSAGGLAYEMELLQRFSPELAELAGTECVVTVLGDARYRLEQDCPIPASGWQLSAEYASFNEAVLRYVLQSDPTQPLRTECER